MKEQRRQGVSPELDELAGGLMGQAFDALAEDGRVDVLLAVQDAAGHVASLAFCDDAPEECLAGARARVRSLDASGGDSEAGLGRPVRYAICYEGAVADDAGVFRDAVILEFGERGYLSFSAFSFVEGVGEGDDFRWTDPAPAGQLEPLL